MAIKSLFSKLANLTVGAVAGSALVFTAANAYAEAKKAEATPVASVAAEDDATSDEAMSDDEGDSKCSGDKQCSGDKSCSGDSKCSGDEDK